jgi:hypothetical protein
VSIRYSVMAPDSQRVRCVFGSMMEGTRPLGLMEMYGSDLTSVLRSTDI